MVAVGQAERLAAREQQGRLEVDPWQEKIAEFLALQLPDNDVTIADLLTKLGVETARRERFHEMRVGNVLRELGYERKRGPRASGRPRPWVYRLAEGRTEEDDSLEPDTDHERCDEQK